MEARIIQISEVRQERKHKKLNRELDLIASIVALEECLRTLNFGDLPETKELKNND
jgi:hypothetical protein